MDKAQAAVNYFEDIPPTYDEVSAKADLADEGIHTWTGMDVRYYSMQAKGSDTRVCVWMGSSGNVRMQIMQFGSEALDEFPNVTIAGGPEDLLPTLRQFHLLVTALESS